MCSRGNSELTADCIISETGFKHSAEIRPGTTLRAGLALAVEYGCVPAQPARPVSLHHSSRHHHRIYLPA
eukprot:1772876-Pleurochrysis_carterae.AAC.1